MICRSIRTSVCCCAAVLVLALGCTFAAAPESERLLPDTTKGFVSVGDVDVLRESFNRTQWGQLVHDPAMQPFVEDFRHQLQAEGRPAARDLG